MTKREELVKAVEEARDAWNVNTHSAADAVWYALDTEWKALEAYDKENT
jgi:histidinol-phosphate/aromatic aminotransferase/cobyric acid decarboxylase-like protein